MVKKNVISLAKSGTATAKKPVARKPVAKKPDTKKPVAKKEPELTPEEQRNLKAKERVNELLQGVDLTLDKKEELLELDETPVAGDSQSLDWLQDQITLLSQANEQLRNDLEAARTGSPAPANDGTVKQNVVTLFNELQENHVRMGGNFRVYFPAFLNRMVMFFPFLTEHKRY